jgi:hypothetical protein
MADWKISKREHGCTACERPFDEGEAHFSLLSVTPETLGREDRCVPCFEAEDERPAEAVFWRTRHHTDKKRLAVDFETVEVLFKALEGRTEERLAELRYLLGLMLMRKKRLKLVRVRRSEGEEGLVLRWPGRPDDPEVTLPVFDLDAERARILRDDLARIFEGAEAEDLLAGVPAAPEPDSEGSGEPSEGPGDEADPEALEKPVPIAELGE